MTKSAWNPDKTAAGAFLKTASIYQIFLRSFTQEGTLKAAQKLLPHLSEMGFDILYLCPVAEADDDANPDHWSERQKASQMGNPKNPYRIKDYYAVDGEYGTNQDLEDFVREAHGYGMRVLLDLVYFHCGPAAVFLQEHPDFVQRDEKGEIRYLDWHFPGINYDSLPLREYLWQNMEYFVRRFDVDGYRCDVGDMCPLDFWEEGRRRLEAIRPDILMLNEGQKPEYLERAFDMSYCFGWCYALAGVLRGEAPASSLVSQWQKFHDSFPQGARLLRALDNHDTVSDSYENRAETYAGHEGMEAALVLNYMLDGIPFVYNGNEVADANRHSIFANRFYGKNLVIDWSNGLTPYGRRRMEVVKQLNRLRHLHPVLWEGETHWKETDADESVVAFTRNSRGENLLIVVNLSKKPVSVALSLDGVKAEKSFSILQKGEVQSSDSTFRMGLPAFGYAVLKYGQR